MAITPGSRRQDTRLGSDEQQAPLGTRQDPTDPLERPLPRTGSESDLNLSRDGTTRRTGSPASAYAARDGRSFTTTFVIAAIVLVAAFLIALYVGSSRTNVATNPVNPPVAETVPSPAAPPSDATGSTTTPQQTAPGTGDAGSGGTGTTAPANP